MQRINILIILCILFLTACSVENATQTSTVKSEYGYVRLCGSMMNREAFIDGNLFGVDPEADTNTIRVKSGTHNLEIRSKNRSLFAQEMLITSGQTTEVTVP